MLSFGRQVGGVFARLDDSVLSSLKRRIKEVDALLRDFADRHC